MEPFFTKPELPRYSQRPFPAYRFRPYPTGKRHPHPRTDPAGHSYQAEEEYLPSFSADDWRSCEPYLYGIDLFNHAYWWETHEALETVWMAAGMRASRCGKVVQGLIQVSIAQLKRFIGVPEGARRLTASGVERMALADPVYLGIEMGPFIEDVQRCLREDRGEYPRIELHF